MFSSQTVREEDFKVRRGNLPEERLRSRPFPPFLNDLPYVLARTEERTCEQPD